MAILRLVIWVMLFMMATFFWVVVFEHGLAGFPEGCGEEFRNFRDFLGSDEGVPVE